MPAGCGAGGGLGCSTSTVASWLPAPTRLLRSPCDVGQTRTGDGTAHMPKECMASWPDPGAHGRRCAHRQPRAERVDELGQRAAGRGARADVVEQWLARAVVVQIVPIGGQPAPREQRRADERRDEEEEARVAQQQLLVGCAPSQDLTPAGRRARLVALRRGDLVVGAANGTRDAQRRRRRGARRQVLQAVGLEACRAAGGRGRETMSKSDARQKKSREELAHRRCVGESVRMHAVTDGTRPTCVCVGSRARGGAQSSCTHWLVPTHAQGAIIPASSRSVSSVRQIQQRKADALSPEDAAPADAAGDGALPRCARAVLSEEAI